MRRPGDDCSQVMSQPSASVCSDGDLGQGGERTEPQLIVSVCDLTPTAGNWRAGVPAELTSMQLGQQLIGCQPPADSRLQLLVSCSSLVSATLSVPGRPARTLLVHRPISSPSSTAAVTQQLAVLEADCTCGGDASAICAQHQQLLHLAAGGCGDMQVRLDRAAAGRGGGVQLVWQLMAAGGWRQLCLLLESGREMRAWVPAEDSGGGGFPQIRTLELSGGRSGCLDVHAIGQLFPELRLLVARGEETRPDEAARCQCRFRDGTLLPRLEQARLRALCTTATAALRACAKSLHTLQLTECPLTPPRCAFLSPRGSSGAHRTFRDIIQAVLRRKFITLPNIQIRRLEMTNQLVDVALLNHSFPCLKRLQVVCRDMVLLDDAEGQEAGQPSAALAGGLWFPSLEQLQLTYRSPDAPEPCILRHQLPRLLDYTQSFGRLRLERLAALCPRLERLALDPVLLDDGTGRRPPPRLPQLLQLTVSWCDADTLRHVSGGMPALQSVRVVEPPFLDKAVWLNSLQSLQQRGVDITLDW